MLRRLDSGSQTCTAPQELSWQVTSPFYTSASPSTVSISIIISLGQRFQALPRFVQHISTMGPHSHLRPPSETNRNDRTSAGDLFQLWCLLPSCYTVQAALPKFPDLHSPFVLLHGYFFPLFRHLGARTYEGNPG